MIPHYTISLLFSFFFLVTISSPLIPMSTEKIIECQLKPNYLAQAAHNKWDSTFYTFFKQQYEKVQFLQSPRDHIRRIALLNQLTPILNKSDNQGKTVLMYACIYNKTDLLKNILATFHKACQRRINDLFAIINQEDRAGKTALIHAIENKHTRAAQIILDETNTTGTLFGSNGRLATIAHTDNQGRSVLYYAIQHNKSSLIKMLLNQLENLHQHSKKITVASYISIIFPLQQVQQNIFRQALEQGNQQIVQNMIDFLTRLLSKSNNLSLIIQTKKECEPLLSSLTDQALMHMLENFLALLTALLTKQSFLQEEDLPPCSIEQRDRPTSPATDIPLFPESDNENEDELFIVDPEATESPNAS